jgi:multidrug resistance efflux pump
LSQGTFDARLQRARAQVKQTKVTRAEARRELKRSKDMFERTLLSVHQLELKKIAFTQADTNYRKALADLKIAKIKKSLSVIKAPFKGVILAVRVTPGQAIVSKAEARPVIEVGNVEQMRASSLLTVEQMAKLRVGQKVDVVAGGKTYPGTIAVKGVEPANKGSSLRYRLDVLFEPTLPLTIVIGEKASIRLK